MKDILKRSLSGLAIVSIILAGIILHPVVFAAVFCCFLLVVLFEFYKISEKLGFQPLKTLGLFAGFVLFVIMFLVANRYIRSEFLGVLILLPVIIFISDLFSSTRTSFNNSMITVAGVAYVALPFGLLNFIEVRGFGDEARFYPWILVGIFLIIWMYDSMAYLFGSLLGKHKICKRISPLKSWEGLIGGAVFALIMGIVNSMWIKEIDVANWLVVALLIVIFGTSSDFFESKLKREAGVKDSGNILPGHGGLLDRFDTLLFAIPVIFVWLVLIKNI